MTNRPSGITAGDWLKAAAQQLGKSPTASLDARLLLAEVLNLEPNQVLLHLDEHLNPNQLNKLSAIHKQRRDGVPLAYIVGRKDFADFQVKVNKSVLIPRPETEAVLAAAIECAREIKPQTIYEVGTGSGVLAIGMARALPGVEIIASDISAAALRVAQTNITEHGLDNQIQLVQSDLAVGIEDAELLVANLPYLPTGLKVSREVKQEPGIALWSGKDGLDHYRKLFTETKFGVAVIELGANQYQILKSWVSTHLNKASCSPITGLDSQTVGMIIRAN